MGTRFDRDALWYFNQDISVENFKENFSSQPAFGSPPAISVRATFGESFSMKMLFFVCAIVLMTTVSLRPAFATKEFGEHFKKFYVDDSKNEEFKKLVAEAKCNVCHIDGENKKKHNPFGETLKAGGLLKKTYAEMIKKEPDKARKEIEEILKKSEEKKAPGKDKTFGERIEAGLLPGGDAKGKQTTEKLISFNAPVAEFVELFDGKSTDGWKINENPKSWSIVDGCIVCQGERCHIFYVGDKKPFKNFHFKADVKTMPNSNAGIYFHTEFQEEGWPKKGFECQVNNSYKGDPRRTSSLYSVKDVLEPAAKDNEWYTQEIIVQGKQVTLKVNGKTLVEYTEPNDQEAGKDFERKLGEGTFALQAHDPGSKVYFKNLMVKRLD